jgi:arylsulfatase A-like enzyme/Flp pilus assembly protein TadD
LSGLKRLLGVVIAILALFGALTALWWRQQSQSRIVSSDRPHPNVVLITIDTLRADRLRRGFTPSLDALADAGARFDNARTVVPLTLPAHVTLMTGALPAAHGVHDNGVVFKPGPPTIARVFRDAGYRTGAFVGAYVLNRRFGLHDGFDTYDDAVHRDPEQGARLEAERRGADVINAALGWVREAPQPFFLWVHLYDPHAPYDPPGEFRPSANGNPYDAEVAYADAQVGRLVAELRVRGLLDRTIVSVAGDHGEGLGDHGEQTHGMLVYDSTLRVPLIVAAPGWTTPTVFTDTVSLTDLAGSLLHMARVTPPAGMGGSFLLSRKPQDRDVYGETEYPRVAGWHPLASLVDDRWKLILSSETELYDLSVDQGETKNLASTKPALVEGMRRRVLELARARDTAASQPAISAEAAERLRALGYVSGPSVPKARDNAMNPSRAIDAWTRFEAALTLVNSGRAVEALRALKPLAARFPDAPVFQSTYARALKEAGQAPSAVAIYRRAIARWPEDALLYHDLAVAARAAGDAREAIRAEQASLAINKDDPAALNGLGLLEAEAGRPAEAAAAFARAAEADPSNASYWANLGNAQREMGDLDRADAAYRRALEIDRSYPDAANGLGVVLVQRRRAADAIPFFERALARSRNFHEARLNLGIAYQESGRLEQATSTYRELVASAPAGSRERKAASELLRGLKR